MKDNILQLLKLDLGITHNLRDAFFIQLLQASQNEILKRGIILDLDAVEDQMLISDYSAWVYRNRTEDVDLAKNIQNRLRNRIIEGRIKRQDETV